MMWWCGCSINIGHRNQLLSYLTVIGSMEYGAKCGISIPIFNIQLGLHRGRKLVWVGGTADRPRLGRNKHPDRSTRKNMYTLYDNLRYSRCLLARYSFVSTINTV